MKKPSKIHFEISERKVLLRVLDLVTVFIVLYGMTLLPYLHTLDIKDKEKKYLHYFKEPSPAREVSIIQHKSELKPQIVNAIYDVISGIVRGAIAFQDVKIISPVK
mgnify:CR=1 FL=1